MHILLQFWENRLRPKQDGANPDKNLTQILCGQQNIIDLFWVLQEWER